jgi:hypothetical protein
MDDITRKRLEQLEAEVDSHASSGTQNVVVDVTSNLVEIGIPADCEGAGLAMALLTMPLGNMAAFGVPIETVRELVDAVAGVDEGAAYDLCSDMEPVAAKLESIADRALGGPSEPMFYTWARLVRNGIAEIVFALEDHYPDPREQPIEKLREVAVAAARFMVETGYPIYLQMAADATAPRVL